MLVDDGDAGMLALDMQLGKDDAGGKRGMSCSGCEHGGETQTKKMSTRKVKEGGYECTVERWFNGSEQPKVMERRTDGIAVRGGPGVALPAMTNSSPDLSRKIN